MILKSFEDQRTVLALLQASKQNSVMLPAANVSSYFFIKTMKKRAKQEVRQSYVRTPLNEPAGSRRNTGKIYRCSLSAG
jgi:hypothetical protein